MDRKAQHKKHRKYNIGRSRMLYPAKAGTSLWDFLRCVESQSVNRSNICHPTKERK